MQPLKPWIAVRPKFSSPRHKRGDQIGFICGDCGTKWYRHDKQKHKDNCPRALRHAMEAKSTKDYFKRPARGKERTALKAARQAALRLLFDQPNLSRVEMGITNVKNPNGWHLTATREAGKVSFKQNRFLMTTWARRHGYVDAD